MRLIEAWEVLIKNPWSNFKNSTKEYNLKTDKGCIVIKDNQFVNVTDVSLLLKLIRDEWEECEVYKDFGEAVHEYAEKNTGFFFKDSTGKIKHQFPGQPLGVFLEGPDGFTVEEILNSRFYPFKIENLDLTGLYRFIKSPQYPFPNNPVEYFSITRHMHDITHTKKWD